MKRFSKLLTIGCVVAAAFQIRADNSFTTLDFPNSSSTQAWGINSRGDVIGFYVTADKNDHGFLYNGGHYTAIDYPGAAVTLINGVNSRGDLVGEFGATASSSHRGFLLSAEGAFTPIDFPNATFTSAIGINARGDIVGFYTFADNMSHTFLLRGGQFSKIDYPGASRTGANGISPQGDIVGGYTLSGVTHGFQYSNAVFRTIDYPNAPNSLATGENAAGDIVGRYIDAAGVSHGYLLKSGQFTAIDYPNATFTGATAIDNAGNITGRCTVAGVTHGFLLASPQPPLRYIIRDLGIVGNAPAQPFVITENRLVSGASAAKDGTMQAVIWSNGSMTSLGSTGVNSLAFGVNASAMAVGATEVPVTDPAGEDFCGFQALGVPSTGAPCLPFVSQYGVMTPIRTLGGTNGVANAVNTRGQVAGLVENTTLDPSCPSPQKYQFKPVLWQEGEAVELPTVKGDLNGVALEINENGQVVGASGACSTFNPNVLTWLQPFHALLWETGRVVDLGSLGGTGNGNGIIALNLNNSGQVVGFSDLPGDKVFHGYVWSKLTGMEDVGVLDGDTYSAAFAINDSGVATGVSADQDFNIRAFIRREGVMTDLNDLIPANSALYVLLACSINSQGEITGLAADANGDMHGYIATPVTGPFVEDLRQRAVPGSARKKLRAVALGRPGFRIIQPK